jgi:hypothetical protein
MTSQEAEKLVSEYLRAAKLAQESQAVTIGRMSVHLETALTSVPKSDIEAAMRETIEKNLTKAVSL